MLSICRTSSIGSFRSQDSGVSDCDLHAKMVSILHVNNNRKDPQDRCDYKITKQRKTKTNTTFREPGRSLGAITSREVDCENNILEPSQVPAVKLEEDEKSSSLASRVMSRPLLDIIEELCGGCDVRTCLVQNAVESVPVLLLYRRRLGQFPSRLW